MNEQEKKNQRIGAYVSIGIHAVLFVLFFVLLAWTEPDPPIPEYGIEFNLGNNIVSENQTEESVQDEKLDDVEEVSEDNLNDGESSDQSNQIAGEESDGEVIESNPIENTESITQDINSPDVIENTPEIENSEIQKVDESDVGVDSKTINSETESIEKEEEKKVEEPKIDDRAIFKKVDDGAGSGNKGASLDLTGWDWDFKPDPNDKSTENGMIVFQIVIDDEGEIIGVKTLEKTISPVVEKIYRDAVMELTFSKTSDNRTVAATSTGKITFIIQSK